MNKTVGSLSRFLPAALLLVTACAGALSLHAGAVRSMIEIWTHDTSFNHGFLVVPVFLWLVYRKKSELSPVTPRFEPLGLLLIALAGAAATIGELIGLNLLWHFGVIGIVQSLIVTIFGREITRKILFPLGFLWFAAPFGTELIVPLQNMTADLSVKLLTLSGVENSYEGIHIITANSRFYVAEACAGLRFLIANIVIGFLFAHLSFRTWRSFLIFLPLCAAVPIVGNILRAYGVMMIAHHSGNEYGAGVDHLVYGWGFFTVLAAFNLWIGSRIADREKTGAVKIDAKPTMISTQSPLYRAVMIALIAIALVAVPFFFGVRSEQARLGARAETFPECAEIAKKIFSHLPKHAFFAQQENYFENIDDPLFHRADKTCKSESVIEGLQVNIGYYAAQESDREIVHYKNRFHDEKNRLLLRRFEIMSENQTPFRAEITGQSGGVRYLTLYVYVNGMRTAPEIAANPAKAKLFLLQSLLLRSDPSGAIFALTRVLPANVTGDRATESFAQATLTEFFASAEAPSTVHGGER